MSARPALSRERVVEAAVRVADDGGLVAVSMRNVGKSLGVEAMSLYHHIPNKEALLDELVEWIFQRMELPGLDDPWRPAMTMRAGSSRQVLAAHPWALGLIESRSNPLPATLRHHDTVLGNLRRNGFSLDLASHAFSVIDAYVFGFVMTESNLPFSPDSQAGVADFVANIEIVAAEYPYLMEMVVEKVSTGSYAFSDEFAYGLDVILDELEHRLAAE